jgi:hypothetical protein
MEQRGAKGQKQSLSFDRQLSRYPLHYYMST